MIKCICEPSPSDIALYGTFQNESNRTISLCVCVVCCVSPLLLHYSVWHTALGIIGFRCNCIKSGHQVHTHTHTHKISLCHSLGSLLNRKWQAFEQFQSQFSNLRIFFSIILKTCMRFHKMSDGK